MNTALFFPGQGSQRVGMGRDLAATSATARAVFDEADAALGFSIAKICFDGPEDTLTLTANTQPAILTNSIAVFRVLMERGLRFDVVAGHSLGEWSALVAAGALSLADAVRLANLRGTYMQEAVAVGVGAMAALLGLASDATATVCSDASRDGEPVEIANLNGGGQIVISGHAAAVERAIALAKTAGAKRAVALSVSAPFHCSLMKPAAERLRAALANVEIKSPSVPVITNVRAEATQDPTTIRQLLVEQVTASVRWEESVQHIASLGVTRGIELGSGSVLRGLNKRIAPTIEMTTIGEPHETDAFTA